MKPFLIQTQKILLHPFVLSSSKHERSPWNVFALRQAQGERVDTPLNAFVIVALFIASFEFAFTTIGYGEPEASETLLKVAIDFPSAQQVIGGITAVRISAQPPAEAAEVTLSRDGSFLDSDSEAPYEISWDTRQEADGPHTLLARMQTRSGRWVVSEAVSVTIDNVPPKVELTGPKPQALVTGKTTLEAEAGDNLGLAEVRFFADNIMIGKALHPPYRLPWDPSLLPNGRHTVKAVAVDKAGNSQFQMNEIKIANPNQSPVLVPPAPQTIKEGAILTLTVSAYDPDGARDPLTLRLKEGPPWVRLDPKAKELKASPDYSVASTSEPRKDIPVTLEVCDPEPLCQSRSFTFTVLNVNQPPVLRPLENIKIHEGEPLTIAIQATDPDGDPLDYTCEGLPPWMKFDAAAHTLHGVPGFEVASSKQPSRAYPPTQVQVCDPEPLCQSAKLEISVANTNRPPELEPIGSKTLVEGESLTLTVRASDPDKDPVELSISADKYVEARFTDQKDGTAILQWASRTDQAGEVKLTFTAKSEGNLTDSETIIVRLKEVSLSISGTIMDDLGNPFPGATVQVSAPGEVAKRGLTDRSGFYLVRGLKPKSYMVRPSYQAVPGFSSTAVGAQGVHFSPLSRSVKIEGEDERDVDFTVLPLS